MLFEEYDAEKALEIKGQEEYEKGRAEGKAEGRAEGRAEGKAEGRAEGEADGEKKGFLKALVGLVKNGLLTITQAAEQANMTVEDFELQSANLA